MISRRYLLSIMGGSLLLSGNHALSEEITLAVASNFAKPIQHLVQVFEKSNPNKVNIALGSSGKLYAQIIHGAPFDGFFSADQSKVEAIQKAGLDIDNTRFTYAIGRLVLWSGTKGLVDPNGDVLRRNDNNYIALANPKLAPYGLAATQVLKALGLDKTTRSRWVQGENISQTYQFVYSGNAELGFVAASQVFNNNQLLSGSAWLIPEHLYTPIKQDSVQLKRSNGNAAYQEFIHFLRSDQGKEIIMSYGYSLHD